MTVFNVYEADSGRLTQSNKVFSPKGYDKILHERGHLFVSHDAPAPTDMARFFVNHGVLTERPKMSASVSSTSIKAGGAEAAIFKDVPKNARVTIQTGGLTVWSGVIGDSHFDLPIPVPCIYRVTIQLWPYVDWVCDVRAS